MKKAAAIMYLKFRKIQCQVETCPALTEESDILGRNLANAKSVLLLVISGASFRWH
jgi:hypothetical protein